MSILFSLVEFLIMLLGIAVPLTLLCICLPVIYFVLSLIRSLIMDKIHPKPAPPPPRPSILLSPASFYQNERPFSPRHHIFYLAPYDSDVELDFVAFTMAFLHKFFRSSPFVVEQVQYCCDDNRFSPQEEDFVLQFQQRGGQVFFPNELTTRAAPPPHHPHLYESMEQMMYEFLRYELFELPAPLSAGQLSDPNFEIQSTDFTCHICINLEPGHMHIQIEAERTVTSFLEPLWDLCRRMDRKLVLNHQSPSENNTAQSE